MKESAELRALQALGNATAQPDATGGATVAQPKRLKALAQAVLGRNRESNRSATEGGKQRNFAATEGGAAEARRQRVQEMLADNPETRYAALTDTNAAPGFVLLTLAIRDRATVELLIPAEKWDGVLFLDLLERHGATVH